MEMDSVCANSFGHRFDERPDEQSLPPQSSDVDYIFGTPEISPRVGKEYQVAIPHLLTGLDYFMFTKNLKNEEIADGDFHRFEVGLPIPIMWINDDDNSVKHEMQEAACDLNSILNKSDASTLKTTRETESSSECDKFIPKVEPLDGTVVYRTKLSDTGNFSMQQDTKIEVYEIYGRKIQCLVPGTSSGSWTDIEEAGFILGLYIFGKNLVQVKRFIGNKDMGDILSFYYGKFYRSSVYRRWDCRKIRSRKCIYGQKIFTGVRQQELLSRLLPNVPEEKRTALHEMSKAFGEGKMLLEEYVLTLKAAVGLSALVEAVGIGKGRQDLTGITVEPLKSMQNRLEIPFGKAWSSLTPMEIVNFLKGDFRLSKARSSDLFWEAVWPRLLARGWHSEQSDSCGYTASSKNLLVFLVPGVKKFSRRELVKGYHYFDSVSDVLSKVASNPAILEIENGTDNGYANKEEDGWPGETRPDQENSPDEHRHFYLKPRILSHGMDSMKFNVVDTSMVGGKTSKLTELRSLPVEVMNASPSYTDCEDDEDTSEEQRNESDSVNTICSNRDEIDVPKVTASQEEHTLIGPDTTNQSTNTSKGQKADLFDDIQSRIALKWQSSQRMIPHNKHLLAPVMKPCRRINACSRMNSNSSGANVLVGPKHKPENISCCPENASSGKNTILLKEPSKENKSSAVSNGAIGTSNPSCSGDEHWKPQTGTLIDLNVPILQYAEADELFKSEMAGRPHDKICEKSVNPCEGTNSKCLYDAMNQPNDNSRRQSKRNRPLTTRVLEAFAFGYLDKKEKRKDRDSFCSCKSTSRPSRRVRPKVNCETFGRSVVDSQREERVISLCDGNGDMVSSSINCERSK